MPLLNPKAEHKGAAMEFSPSQRPANCVNAFYQETVWNRRRTVIHFSSVFNRFSLFRRRKKRTPRTREALFVCYISPWIRINRISSGSTN